MKHRTMAVAALIAACAVGAGGCGGQAYDGNVNDGNANDGNAGTAHYGMGMHAAANRSQVSDLRGDDFLVVGNAVFLAERADGRVADEDVIQRNFRGMRVYRIDDPKAVQAMDRLQAALGQANESKPDKMAADFRTLLEHADEGAIR
ncbi:hypothetical protein MO973_43610 [Paenibacillus sp. TRM 82003]|nr:hypothetical protein [Paenibacillus sp. TRM 82003]